MTLPQEARVQAAKFGERGCGSWSCKGGQCAISEDCRDEDQDGYFVGADCAGKPLDCDDHDPNTADTASASCCGGGTRACSAGSRGLCSTATGETCEHLDCAERQIPALRLHGHFLRGVEQRS